MPLVKPVIGQYDWGPTLNTALDYLDDAITSVSLTTGDVTFEGVKVIGAGTASGDGNEYGTLELVPDSTRYDFDQYLIIDPTAPNHIHIRAGGTQDGSAADLILGGEQAHVLINDGAHQVNIQSYSTELDTTYYWNFGSDGVLYGPAMGGLVVTSINNFAEDYPFQVYSGDSIVITGTNGEFLNDSTDPGNQIATVGDLPTGANGSFTTVDGKAVTVTNGIITAIETI